MTSAEKIKDLISLKILLVTFIINLNKKYAAHVARRTDNLAKNKINKKKHMDSEDCKLKLLI